MATGGFESPPRLPVSRPLLGQVQSSAGLCSQLAATHLPGSRSGKGTAGLLPTPPSPARDSGQGPGDAGASSPHPPAVAAAARRRSLAPRRPPDPEARLPDKCPAPGTALGALRPPPAAAPTCWRRVRGSRGRRRRARGAQLRGRPADCVVPGSPAPGAAARSGRARREQPGRRRWGPPLSARLGGAGSAVGARRPQPRSPLPARPAGHGLGSSSQGRRSTRPARALRLPPASAGMRSPPPSAPAGRPLQVSCLLLPTLSRAETAPLAPLRAPRILPFGFSRLPLCGESKNRAHSSNFSVRTLQDARQREGKGAARTLVRCAVAGSCGQERASPLGSPTRTKAIAGTVAVVTR